MSFHDCREVGIAAAELANRDPFSSALYTEYSLELGTLAIYFPEHRNIPEIDRATWMVFFTGICVGLLIGILVMQVRVRTRPKYLFLKSHATSTTMMKPKQISNTRLEKYERK